MGKDAPAQPAPQAEAEKVRKPPDQDKKWSRRKRRQSAGAVPQRNRITPRAANRRKGPKPRTGRPAKADKAALGKSPSPVFWTKCPEVGKSTPAQRGDTREPTKWFFGGQLGTPSDGESRLNPSPPRSRRRRPLPRRSSCRPRRRCRPARWNRAKSSI